MAGAPKFRVRPSVLKHRAIDKGVEPTTEGIAAYTGLDSRTVRGALAGRPLTSPTLYTLAACFPGSEHDDLFEARPDGEADTQLRVVP